MSKRSLVWFVSKDKLQSIINESSSFREVIMKLGFKGNNRYTLTKRIKHDQIDITILAKNRRKIQYRGIKRKALAMDEILRENSSYARGDLKRRLIKDNTLKNECSMCKQSAEWNNKELVMVLDHINGINNDNRLENLRLLCPNCNSQTETFAGRNFRSKKIKTCICGNKIACGSTRCVSCSYKELKEDRVYPLLEELEKGIEDFGWIRTAEKYKVSVSSIKKWIKKYKQGSSFEPRKITNKPSFDLLKKQIETLGYRGTGKIHGVTGSAVKKWFQKYLLEQNNSPLV